MTLLGIAGVVVNLIAYGLLSSGRLGATDLRYQLMNIMGTIGILLSLFVQWNLSSFVLNVAWLLIGIVGVIRIYRIGRAAA